MSLIWRPVKDFEGFYEISNWGHIRSVGRMVRNSRGDGVKFCKSRELKPNKTHQGYLTIRISKLGKAYQKYIHRMVAESFIQNKKNKRCVNHIDGNKTNNCDSNLEWVTHQENNIHAYKNNLMHGVRGEASHLSKLTEKQVTEIRQKYKPWIVTCSMIAKEYGISRSYVTNLVKGVRWGHLSKRKQVNK